MKVGLQVFSIKENMAKDPLRAMENAVKIGYQNLEAANHKAMEDDGIGFGVGVKELKEMMARTGAKIVSAHVSPLDKDRFQKILEYHAELGNHNLVYPIGRFEDYDDLMRQCTAFNEYGDMAKQYDIRFHYHNHAHEFMTMDGRLVLDLIMKNTDPDKMGLELDTFWVMRAGLDPLEMIRKYASRITLLHQKDMAKNTPSPVNVFSGLDREVSEEHVCDFTYWKEETSDEDFAEIGTGIMDIQKIIDTANKYTKTEYLFLEQDQTRMESEEASITKSIEEFRKFNGIEW